MSTLPGEPVTIKGLYYWKCDNNKIKETLKKYNAWFG